MKANLLYIVLFAIFLNLWACTEPYEIETVDFESVLVVESTITDEFKPQIVKLSKTTTLENPEILFENNATVVVNTNTGSTFDFIWDASENYYVSEMPFKAEPNVAYTLSIITQDGKRYSSSEVVLPPSVEMTE